MASTSNKNVQYFRPADPVDAGMIVIPGGRYQYIGEKDCEPVAQWLNRHHLHAWVLRYECGEASKPLGEKVINEAKEAWNAIRKDFPGKIGIWGWSAGGHLAAMIGTNTTLSVNFLVLSYAVITMETDYTHIPSRVNLLGKNPSHEQIDEMSAERRVTKETPPTFIFHTKQDESVPVENSIKFAEALNRERVPFVLKVQEEGKHGMGLAEWTDDLAPWLENIRTRRPVIVGDTSDDWVPGKQCLHQNHRFE
ncbi:hypothetical protein GQX73_g10267 [Xylaria multiplex]|uniref:Peptidase S9 prolyl oligopeptidase catalytic domain-containing protein n=1 Tax=Xylaria multiplex TaxID=323545 RepID=A0A7C8ILD0_9PEZI|nr:hypothetical protein GQX73_g10267 [Xylaria multiplex]